MSWAEGQSSAASTIVHPNEFDKKRIERTIEDRVRYRYVSPTVRTISGGYRIESPCCSRTVDPDGGVIDIAQILYDDYFLEWRLFYKDHNRQRWELHSVHHLLHELLQGLNSDPERIFWQ